MPHRVLFDAPDGRERLECTAPAHGATSLRLLRNTVHTDSSAAAWVPDHGFAVGLSFTNGMDAIEWAATVLPWMTARRDALRIQSGMAKAIVDAGLLSYLAQPNQMIVSRQRWPLLPSEGNSFWLTLQEGTWFLVTWCPACYPLPKGREIEVILAIVDDSAVAQYVLSDSITSRFGIIRLPSDREEQVLTRSAEPA